MEFRNDFYRRVQYITALRVQVHRAAAVDPAGAAAAVALLNLQWPGILWPFKNTELTAEEKMWFENFSLKETSAFKPSDKAEVLEKISQMWGKPENFEEFVRTELVDIFAESKRRYAHQIRRIALSALETTFGG